MLLGLDCIGKNSSSTHTNMHGLGSCLSLLALDRFPADVARLAIDNEAAETLSACSQLFVCACNKLYIKMIPLSTMPFSAFLLKEIG